MIIITYRPLYCVFALKLGIPSRKFLAPPLVAGMVDSDVMEYIGGQLQVSKHYSSPPEHQQPQPTAQLRRGQLVEQFVGSGFGRSYTISSLRLAVG